MAKVWVAHERPNTVWGVYAEEPTDTDRQAEGLNKEEWCISEVPVQVSLQDNTVSCELGRCNFCGNTEEAGFKVVQGPMVAICADCVRICAAQLNDWDNSSSTRPFEKESKSKEKTSYGFLFKELHELTAKDREDIYQYALRRSKAIVDGKLNDD